MTLTDTLTALRAALLDGIEDAAVAAVYADCCDESGDVRLAEFWRLVAARHLWPLRSETKGQFLGYERGPGGRPIRIMTSPRRVWWDWHCDCLSLSALGPPHHVSSVLFAGLGEPTGRRNFKKGGRVIRRVLVKRFGGGDGLRRALLALEAAWTQEGG